MLRGMGAYDAHVLGYIGICSGILLFSCWAGKGKRLQSCRLTPWKQEKGIRLTFEKPLLPFLLDFLRKPSSKYNDLSYTNESCCMLMKLIRLSCLFLKIDKQAV